MRLISLIAQKTRCERRGQVPNSQRVFRRIDLVRFYQSFLFVLVLYRIYQFRYIPFGSPDDTFMASRSMSLDGNLAAALDQAKSQGRFYQFFFMLFTMSVYEVIPHGFLWTVIAAQIAMFVISLYMSVSILYENKFIGILIATLFLMFYDFRGGYNNLTSFPLWFCFSFTMFLFSIVFLCKFRQSKNSQSNNLLLVSYLLAMFASLAYESYLVFPLLLLSLDIQFSILDSKGSSTFREKTISSLQDTKSRICSVVLFYVIYLSLYMGFRILYPSNYPGTQISLNSFGDPIKAILRLSFGGLVHFITPYLISSLVIFLGTSLRLILVPFLESFVLALWYDLSL